MLFPFTFSLSQNFFQAILISFSVKLSFGNSILSSSSIFSDFLKFKLAMDNEETSSLFEVKSLISFLFTSKASSNSLSSLITLLENSEVLIKEFFFF